MECAFCGKSLICPNCRQVLREVVYSSRTKPLYFCNGICQERYYRKNPNERIENLSFHSKVLLDALKMLAPDSLTGEVYSKC